MNHFCIHPTSTEFLRIWPVLAMPRTLALGRNRTEPNVMLLLPLLHKVNGRFSINHRTTNTGMAAAEEKGGRMEIAPSSRETDDCDCCCVHIRPPICNQFGGWARFRRPFPVSCFTNLCSYLKDPAKPQKHFEKSVALGPGPMGSNFAHEIEVQLGD